MTLSTSSQFMMILVVQSLCTAQGGRASVATRVNQRAWAYHPGHPPHHVTRLHRYEHTGMQSMLEEEARWALQSQELQSSSQPGRNFREVHRIRGTSMLEESHEALPEYSDFVKLSGIQSQALQEHHRTWIAHALTFGEEDVKTPPPGALLQKYSSHLSSSNEDGPPGDAVVATGLSKLSSQYVGPIGVGTVASPTGCVMKNGTGSVGSGETNSSVLGRIGGLFSSLHSQLANVSSKLSSSFEQSCTTRDESKVWVVFDTGSTNIWIPSDLCKGACKLPGRHWFNHTASATFKYPQSMLQLSVQFGTGKITGPQAVDDFHIGPFTVHNQTFAMIEQEEGNVWYDTPFEGIVGMAMDAMSANHVKPFFSSMIEQKALKHNEFAFYFSHDQPSANALFWGGVDKNFYEGKLQYFPVVDPYYWSLKLLGFKIGSDAILDPSVDTYDGTANAARKWNGPVAVVDTGTTFFTAESQKFHDVMEKLPPAECNAINEKTHPPITITLENAHGEAKDFVMTNKQYMSESGSRCSPAFMQIDLPAEHGPGMVLGEVFLRHFLGVFDRGSGSDSDARVAFAKSSSKPAAFRRLHELTADQPAFSTNRSTSTGSQLDNVK